MKKKRKKSLVGYVLSDWNLFWTNKKYEPYAKIGINLHRRKYSWVGDYNQKDVVKVRITIEEL